MSLKNIIEKVQMHYKCRNTIYPKSNNVIRFSVPDDKVRWEVQWPEYNPVFYTSTAIKGQSWADPSIEKCEFKPKWNTLDGNINRKSHFKDYDIVGGLPLNPIGRTGISGRGCLGRWGPNHAADPILTRWKRKTNEEVECDEISKKPILQFVAIQRRDCLEWALPGGMVDPGEHVSSTLKREFLEEALNILSLKDQKEKEKRILLVEEFFSNGTEIYKGYVDDPRNTDNSWMETVATNFHDESGTYVGCMPLSAGDDALKVKWVDINSNLSLYANHKDFILKIVQIRNCHW